LRANEALLGRGDALQLRRVLGRCLPLHRWVSVQGVAGGGGGRGNAVLRCGRAQRRAP
jgi:hypothetical protein